MIRKMEHVGIRVKDMDASIAFYTKVLGMHVAGRVQLNPEVELAFLTFDGDDGVQIELVGNGSEAIPERGKVDHVAFTITDIEAEAARLREAGVPTLDEQPRTILNGVKIFFFKGPDGEVLELFQPADVNA